MDKSSAETWIAAATLALTIGGTIGLTTWRLANWLGKQFNMIRMAYSESLEAHEEKDEGRHLQNLARFESINVALARMEPRRNGSMESRHRGD